MSKKPEFNQIVLVIDDDESMRVGLSHLFQSMDLPVQMFGSAAELLKTKLPEIPSCLVLDIRLPGVNGLEFQDILSKAGMHIPIIFVTGHGDIPMSVRAMKAGAVDFLTKPFRDQDILDAVTRALDLDRKRRAGDQALSDLRRRFESLSTREREVLSHATAGLMNKQIAGLLNLSEITVKIHRMNLMKKMQAKSLAELVKMAQALGIGTANP
jgi:FixJ family two-component response regulator